MRGAAAAVFASVAVSGLAQEQPKPQGLTLADLEVIQGLLGTTFSQNELKEILSDVQQQVDAAKDLRQSPFSNSEPVASMFSVLTPAHKGPIKLKTSPTKGLKRPSKEEDIAFLSVRELGALVKSKQITSTELTKISLARLKRYNPKLLNVITLTEGMATIQAARADEEIRKGKYRGPLHGLPYGLKDLFAVRGANTTWGATPYRDQYIDHDCTVHQKLQAAGAVLVAKLTLGALAMDDKWFGGQTKTPWNPGTGSSGSSAGSASAVAAGCVPFAIGTETSGSIVSPSHFCRVTGLRPTFGSISRAGAMALSWSMDKVGPICRDSEDCAIVFSALLGPDPGDRDTVERGFEWQPTIDFRMLRIGLLTYTTKDMQTPLPTDTYPWLQKLVELGAKVARVMMPPVHPSLFSIISAESSAAFESLTRSPAIQDLKENGWPQSFRSSMFLTAVDLIQADRQRRRLMDQWQATFTGFDAIVAPSRADQAIYALNLTGHPQVLVPWEENERKQPRSYSVIGHHWQEAKILAIALTLQKALGTTYDKRRPDMKALLG